MNTAALHASRLSSTRYTSQESSIHLTYAAKCARAKRFEDYSSRFMAMKTECQLLGLRWCTSQEFRNLARLCRVGGDAPVRNGDPVQEYFSGEPLGDDLIFQNDHLFRFARRRGR